MEVSGVSSGVIAATATNNGNANINEVEKKAQEVETQTDTQTNEAVPQPTRAMEGNLGTKFNANA